MPLVPTLCCHFIVFYIKCFFLYATVFLPQYNFQKVTGEKNSCKHVPFTTNTSYLKKCLNEEVPLHFFIYRLFQPICYQDYWLWFRPRGCELPSFQNGPKYILCHDLAKLPVIQSCDLLSVLSPHWGFNDFAAQIKAELLEAIFFDIQRKI